MEEYTSRIAKYWDDMLDNIFDYGGDMQILQKIFQENDVKSVMDIGCGTGKHLRYLAKLDYNCTGLDDSQNMLLVAREKAAKDGLEIEFIECDIRDIDVKRKFDAIISLYSLNLPDIEDTQKIFKGVYNALKDKGIFIFDVMNAENEFPGERMPPANAEITSTPPSPPIFSMEVLMGGKEDVRIVRLNSFLAKGPIQDWNAVYLIEENGKLTMEPYHSELRLFHPDEIEKILNECGFRVESTVNRQIQMVKDMLICARKQG